MANERHLWPLPSPELAATPSPKGLRDVMSSFATGVTVLTAGGEHGHGMTANAFSSVSLDPPMVLCCIARTAQMHEAILRSRHFAVNVLSAEQEPVARYFASRGRPRGLAQFDEVEWSSGPRSGAPLLAGALAWLECELAEVYHGGDHSIFLGSVLDAARRPGEALLFFGGGFHQGMPTPRSA
ncbi:MAG TPA: flavin reductase family protein [Actinophytocola sp.]|jgi:flavin reductase (DIM6/NTAB) family NADH-FMN oxidoreductase RutF|uniref:flavin reductase family protein n=1 Tax=Actinophytocola sp. TaxID=1872138 RepID=UPI002F94D692